MCNKDHLRYFLWIAIMALSICCFSQDLPPVSEQQLEDLAISEDEDTDDDSYLQRMEQFLKTPVNLNTGELNELRELPLITIFQIENLISYRKLLGKLISIYELQAVPGWDVLTISRIMPYVSIELPYNGKEEFRKRLSLGEHSVLTRISQVLEKAKGFNASTGKYEGSPQKMFLRYRYSYKDLLQFGATAEKDAGEPFFRNAQQYGFDFYSFHLFARRLGRINCLAIGDFTVNMGQGLIQWQSLAFKKSAEITAIKRQSTVLRPYTGTGEFNFLRGIGMTIRKGKIEMTGFFSLRKLSAGMNKDSTGVDFFSSFQASGYHRTVNEIADRNRLRQIVTGGNIKLSGQRGKVSVNGIYTVFQVPLRKKEEPYNLYAINDNSWYNISMDYDHTYNNIHFFGEIATDKKFNKALLQGLLISADNKVDISLLYRRIDPGYQTLNGNAFTENTLPGNETGFFCGIIVRPASSLKFSLYADIYRFPWLKYLVNAPGGGRDFQVQCNYTPDRQTEIYSRYRFSFKTATRSNPAQAMNVVEGVPQKNWRIYMSHQLNRAVLLRSRMEMLWYDQPPQGEKGFLFFTEVLYKPLLKRFSATARLQYFETDSYAARVYAYENDVLSAYSVPASFGKGYRYYLLVSIDLSGWCTCWLRFAQTIYHNNETIGSGNDEIIGKKKTELKLQVRVILK